MHREWIEPALEMHLERVRAPEELWERIQNPRVEQRQSARRPAAGMTACLTIAVVVILAVWFYPWHRQLRSADPGEIRAWVRANAGIDVPLQAQSVGRLRLTGARMVKSSVEIAYQVGSHDGRLVVANGASGGRHVAPSGARVFSWTMDGHIYTLACAAPEDLNVACGLCHIG
jgi:hypothetical protein